MFGWLKRKVPYRNASSGSVHCPRHGQDVELDRCLACGELIDVARGERGEVQIRCDPAAGCDPKKR